MKKILFLMILAISAMQANAQQHLRGEYSSLWDCNNDPLLYIEQNYIQNVSRHFGRTFGDLADTEFELPVEPSQVSPIIYTAGIIGGNDITQNGKCIGIVVKFNYRVDWELFVWHIKYTLHIYFKPPYNQNEDDPASPLYRFSDEEVTWQQYKEMFRDNSIEMIFVYKMKDGEDVTKTYNRSQDYLW